MNGKLTRGVRRYGALAFVFAVGACSWFTDFKEQPKVDPWESSSDTVPFRGNPQNSVSIYGTAAPGYVVSRMALPGTIDSMASIPNPVPADARSLDNGRKYYQINCAVCHGEAGKADGPITKKGMFPPPLVGASAEGRTDGYIWGIIRNGRGLMPSYNRIEELDRWDVVNYVRGLQGRYQVAVGPAGLPGETGDKVPGASQVGPTRPSPYWYHTGSQADMTRGWTATHGARAGTAPSTSPVKAPSDTAHFPATDSTRPVPSRDSAQPARNVTPKPNAGGQR